MFTYSCPNVCAQKRCMANGWYTSLHTVCHTRVLVCHTRLLLFLCMQGPLFPIVDCLPTNKRVYACSPLLLRRYTMHCWYVQGTLLYSIANIFKLFQSKMFFSTTMVKHYNQPLQHGSQREQPQRGWNSGTITQPQHTWCPPIYTSVRGLHDMQHAN